MGRGTSMAVTAYSFRGAASGHTDPCLETPLSRPGRAISPGSPGGCTRTMPQLPSSSLKARPVVVEVVPRHPLRPTGATHGKVVPLGYPHVDRVDRRRPAAVGLGAEPVAVEVPRVDVVGRGDQSPYHDWVSKVSFQNWSSGVAVLNAAEQQGGVAAPRSQRLDPQVQRAAAGVPGVRQRVCRPG